MAADIASLILFVRGVRQMTPVLVVLVLLFLRLSVLTQFMGSMFMFMGSMFMYRACIQPLTRLATPAST